MFGPEVVARSLSRPNVTDSYGNEWQYHSRSDQHSKIACWALMFDLLRTCPLLVRHIELGKVGFGINHEMSDFRTARKKNLDLVLCTPGSGGAASLEFAALADRYAVILTPEERTALDKLPPLRCVPVGSVHVAVEAKACMTEHIKALPRLYDELNSSHLAIHGSADFAIAAGFAVVNISATFVSPGRNKLQVRDGDFDVTQHRQPEVTIRTIDKLKEIPRRTQPGTEGFDALGIVVLEIRNDGSPVRVVTDPPAPATGDVWHYNQMVRRIASLYATKFGNV
jgi:hypothetical protein